MKTMQILHPTDFSEGSRVALLAAADLARERDAVLHVVHVYLPPAACTESGCAVLPTLDDLEPTRECLQEISPQAVRVRHEVLVGSPAYTIVDYAREHDIDLIVMGTHGRTGVTRMLVGSVAESVMRRAPCPVLTVKAPAQRVPEADAPGDVAFAG